MRVYQKCRSKTDDKIISGRVVFVKFFVLFVSLVVKFFTTKCVRNFTSLRKGLSLQQIIWRYTFKNIFDTPLTDKTGEPVFGTVLFDKSLK